MGELQSGDRVQILISAADEKYLQTAEVSGVQNDGNIVISLVDPLPNEWIYSAHHLKKL